MNGVYCECSDGGCPECGGHCEKLAVCVVFRVDMEDQTGTPMCEGCSDDAMESGLFDADYNALRNYAD